MTAHRGEDLHKIGENSALGGNMSPTSQQAGLLAAKDAEIAQLRQQVAELQASGGRSTQRSTKSQSKKKDSADDDAQAEVRRVLSTQSPHKLKKTLEWLHQHLKLLKLKADTKGKSESAWAKRRAPIISMRIKDAQDALQKIERSQMTRAEKRKEAQEEWRAKHGHNWRPQG